MKENSLSEKIGKVYFYVIGIMGIGWFVVAIGFMIYGLLTKEVPAFPVAVAKWGNDTSTALTEHHWQATDAMLYGGMSMILAIRFRNTILTVWDKYLE